MKKSAFTLAEVLITLGVIGIVFVLTIPALMQAYKKHLIESRLKWTVIYLTDLVRRVDEGEGGMDYSF